jgi:anti-anti-sigma regulatory factor
MYWFGGNLYYANAVFFAEEARRLEHDSPTLVRWFVLDASAISDLDFSAAAALCELKDDLKAMGIDLAFTLVSPSLREDMDREGVTAALGEGRIFDLPKDCIEAFHASAPPPCRPARSEVGWVKGARSGPLPTAPMDPTHGGQQKTVAHPARLFSKVAQVILFPVPVRPHSTSSQGRFSLTSLPNYHDILGAPSRFIGAFFQ